MPTDQALMEARAHLLDLLMSPYTQMQPWHITRACVYLEHPLRPSGVQCVCGKRKVGVARPRPTGAEVET